MDILINPPQDYLDEITYTSKGTFEAYVKQNKKQLDHLWERVRELQDEINILKMAKS